MSNKQNPTTTPKLRPAKNNGLKQFCVQLE